MLKIHQRLGTLGIPMLTMALLLSACGGETTATPNAGGVGAAPPPPGATAAATTAGGQTGTTPAAAGDTAAMYEAAKGEKDGVLVYSIMSEQNWKPVIEGFSAKYPGIKVTTTDLGAYEVFE